MSGVTEEKGKACVARLFLFFLLLASAGGGCHKAPRLLGPAPPAAVPWADLVAASPLPPDENILPTELRRAESLSVHLVRIRDRETPHVHTRYDLVVVLAAGEGTLWLDASALPMRQGDVAIVPKNTPHFFVNEGDAPASALVVFSPAFAGPDQQPVRHPSTRPTPR